MNGTRNTLRVMLLIDADNVTADVIEQAVQMTMARHGAAHVRRAYCTAELALKQLKLFKTHSIRPIVNVSTGKNSTDIALAVDAMELVVAERPDVVVIVSSDSDFAPLVIRLREKGCRVEGIGQEGKTGEDSKPVYDDFIDLPHRKAAAKSALARPSSGRAAPAKRASRASSRSAVADAPPPSVAPEALTGSSSMLRQSVAAPVRAAMPAAHAEAAIAAPSAEAPPPARKRAAKRPARGAAADPVAKVPLESRSSTGSRARPSRRALTEASPPPPAPAAPPAPKPLPDEVERILVALPELQAGGRLQLNLAKERLCNAGLLAKSAPSTKLFRKHPTLFALTPEAAPNKVQFLRPALQ